MKEKLSWQVSKGTFKNSRLYGDLMENKDFVESAFQIRNMLDNDPNKATMIDKLAKKYKLENFNGNPLLHRLISGKDIQFMPDHHQWADMCQIIDGNLQFERNNRNQSVCYEEEAEARNYPIHIGISPLSSKRDVIDYVEKNWQSIRTKLNEYGKEKRIRTRKNRERDNFIWENKTIPYKELANLVNEEFPTPKNKADILDYEISTILSHERKKRSEK